MRVFYFFFLLINILKLYQFAVYILYWFTALYEGLALECVVAYTQ